MEDHSFPPPETWAEALGPKQNGPKEEECCHVKKELDELLILFEDGGEQRVVDAFKKYKALLEQRKRNTNPLSLEEQKRLSGGELRNDYWLFSAMAAGT